MHLYIYMCMCVYIYILYIYKEHTLFRTPLVVQGLRICLDAQGKRVQSLVEEL